MRHPQEIDGNDVSRSEFLRRTGPDARILPGVCERVFGDRQPGHSVLRRSRTLDKDGSSVPGVVKIGGL